jgi:hypothetical protein
MVPALLSRARIYSSRGEILSYTLICLIIVVQNGLTAMEGLLLITKGKKDATPQNTSLLM